MDTNASALVSVLTTPFSIVSITSSNAFATLASAVVTADVLSVTSLTLHLLGTLCFAQLQSLGLL